MRTRMNEEKPNFPLLALATAGLVAGLTGCSILLPAPGDDVQAVYPQPVSFWATDIQVTQLLGGGEIETTRPQLLVDQDGTMHLFWVEWNSTEARQDYVYRRRMPGGSWGEEDRISNEYYYADPVFLRGETGNPCHTTSAGWDSPVIRLLCNTSNGWQEAAPRGYAKLIPRQSKAFLDGSRIVTAYSSMDGNIITALYFGETQLTPETIDVYHFDIAKDNSGAYYVAYLAELISDDAYQLRVLRSEDQGRSWSDPAVLSREATSEPAFFSAPDGGMCLLWMEFRTLMAACGASGGGWRTQAVFEENTSFSVMYNLRTAQGEDGEVHLIIWDSNLLYAVRGGLESGFSEPVRLIDPTKNQEPDYLITELAFALGTDGSYNFIWSAFNRTALERSAKYRKHPAFFGRMPAD
jgi:hypothetical protein